MESATSELQSLHFVHFDPAASRGNVRSKKLAKAYVARMNWQRQKANRGKKRVDGNPFSSSSSPDTACDQALDVAEEVAARQARPQKDHGEVHMWPAFNTLSVVSPVVGALKIESFDIQNSSLQLETAHYYVDVIIASGGMLEHELAARFADICEHPVIFNAVVYAVGMHQTMRDLPVAKSRYMRTLMHQNTAIRMVNAMIKNLDTSNLDHLLFAIMQLWRHNPETEDGSYTEPFLFTPHGRDANWARLYSRMPNDEVHARALYWLLDRIGGTAGIKMLGLAKELHIVDVTRSSAECSRPQFVNMWDKDHYLLQLSAGLYPSLDVQHNQGSGFSQCVPGGLPSQALVALKHVALVAHVLAQTNDLHLDHLDFYTVVGLRNGAQHQLLSLPPWQDLPTDAKTGFQATYESCRITAIIYSNAVLMGLLPSTTWLQCLLQQLEEVLDMANMSSWRESTKNMLTWVLFVASMAAYRTEYRDYFMDALREHLEAHGLRQWNETEVILRDFIWSDSACGEVAAVIWKYMDIEDESVSVEGVR